MNIRGRSAGRKGRKQRCQIVLGSVQASAVLAAAKRCMRSERVEVGSRCAAIGSMLSWALSQRTSSSASIAEGRKGRGFSGLEQGPHGMREEAYGPRASQML